MLKRLFIGASGALALGGAASAADLPPTPPPPAFTWAGFYLGAQVGYGWAKDSYNLTASPPYGSVTTGSSYVLSSVSPQGVVGGVHIGYNWQVNQFVLGLEGDANGASLSKTAQVSPLFSVTTNSPLQGAILGRVGVAFDRALLYATGGVEFAWIRNSYTALGNPYELSTTRTGWTLGGGLEYALTDNWIARAEYRYTNLGNLVDGPIVFPGVFAQHSWTINQVQVGISYKFGARAPAVVAKY